MQLKLILLIGAGSFLGGILRYLLSQTITSRVDSSFPLGTFLINVIGCFLIGIAFGFFEKNHPSDDWRLFITTGLLGGFTTFSAFSMESVSLIKAGHLYTAILYILGSVVIGILAIFLGIGISKIL